MNRIPATSCRPPATLLIALLFCPAPCSLLPAHAAELLFEYGWNQPEPVALPAEYFFWVTAFNQSWKAEVHAFPHESTASPEFIERMNETFVESGANVRLHYRNGFQEDSVLPYGFPLGSIWFAPQGQMPEGNYWRTYVPQRGQGLRGYHIDSVDRLITAESQLLKFYGHDVEYVPDDFVPEPSSAFLLFSSLCLVGCVRRQRHTVIFRAKRVDDRDRVGRVESR